MEPTIDNKADCISIELYKDIIIPVEVEFGNPASKDCLRFGICRINNLTGRSFNLMPPCGKKAQGYLSRWEQAGIELVFHKVHIAPAVFQHLFGSGLFLVETAYPLASTISSQLILEGFTIVPGSYPVLTIGSELHVVFT